MVPICLRHKVRCASSAAVIVATFALGVSAHADQEAPNRGHVTADPWGTCYARSVPAADYGTAGRTDIYLVGTIDEPDRLAASYDLYFGELYLSCRVLGDDGELDVAMAGRGPWPRGREPDDDTLAIAFFHGGAEGARYSTLDISGGMAEAVSCSVSHYWVIGDIEGYQRNGDDREVFAMTTVDGRRLTFDAASGKLLGTVAGPAPDAGRGECF
jgi:hypothetical protein